MTSPLVFEAAEAHCRHLARAAVYTLVYNGVPPRIMTAIRETEFELDMQRALSIARDTSALEPIPAPEWPGMNEADHAWLERLRAMYASGRVVSTEHHDHEIALS